MFERRIGPEAPINPGAAQKLKTAVSLESAGKYESALMSLDEALAIQGNYTDAWLVKGVILGKLGKCSDALKCYDKIIEFNPRNVDAVKMKSATYTSLGLHDKSLECLRNALDMEPQNLELRLSLAGAYQRQKRFDEALQCYQEAKRQQPNDPKIDYLIGVMWGNRADYEKALVSFEIALRNKTDYTDALLGKGLMLAKLGRKEEARQVADKLLEIKGATAPQETPQQKEAAMSQSENESIRNQYLAAQKRFTSKYAPPETKSDRT